MPKPKPIYALPSQERREAAEKFAGLPCTVHVRPFRDAGNPQNYDIEGTILGVAIPNTGTIADQLIVRPADSTKYLKALSLATIHNIERIRG